MDRFTVQKKIYIKLKQVTHANCCDGAREDIKCSEAGMVTHITKGNAVDRRLILSRIPQDLLLMRSKIYN
jgi:hypothetical protein